MKHAKAEGMKMRAVLVAVFLVFAAGAVQAQLTATQQKGFETLVRRSLKLDDAAKKVEEGNIPRRHLSIIYAILKDMNEVEVHRLRGATDNKVYLDRDGKREAVYDARGVLVQDGINDGSYNYFPPHEEPLGHLTFDMAPWLLLGQSRRDSTKAAERAHGYSADFFEGMRRAVRRAGRPQAFDEPDLKKPGAVVALAIMTEAIRRGDAAGVYSAFDDGAKPDDETMVAVVRKFEAGLTAMLQGADRLGKIVPPAEGKDRPSDDSGR